jgi:hypothetical protein
MKRFLALAVSISVGLTVAPIGASATPSAESVVASSPAVVTSPNGQTIDRASKARKCRDYCVQSTLPAAEIATHFANNNRHLISVNQNLITLRNLDTRKIVARQQPPTFSRFIGSYATPDGEEIYLLVSDDETPIRVYRLDTMSLALENVSPVSPTYAIGEYEFAPIPDHSGYLATSASEGYAYLCRYTETGVEVGCTTNYAGAGMMQSQIHFHYSSQFAYIVGADTKLFTFTLEDMSFTQEEIDGLDINVGMSDSIDGVNIFVDHVPFSSSDLSTKVSLVSQDTASVSGVIELPGNVLVEDILAVPYGVYVLGQTYTSRGRAQKYSTLFYIDTYEGFDVTRTVTIPNSRQNRVTHLTRDADDRYILASGENVPTSVIPTSGATIYNSAEYREGPDAWTVTWDFLNLQPGTALKYYDIYLKNDVDGARWVKTASVRAGGEHVYTLANATAGQIMQVLPRGAKMTGNHPIDLETGP